MVFKPTNVSFDAYYIDKIITYCRPTAKTKEKEVKNENNYSSKSTRSGKRDCSRR